MTTPVSGVSYGSDLLLLAGVELSVSTRSYPGHNGDTAAALSHLLVLLTGVTLQCG